MHLKIPGCVSIYLCGMHSRYIGEMSRHFATRVKEHLSTDKNSHVYKHLSGSLLVVNANVQLIDLRL